MLCFLFLITSSEHALMVKSLIYEILLSCHKRHQIFQASKGFSGSFNKHGSTSTGRIIVTIFEWKNKHSINIPKRWMK